MTLTNLSVTSLTALPLALLMTGLAFRVAALRIKNRIGLGVSKNKTLARAMAAHGNAVENIPLALFLLLLAELQGSNSLYLSICGGIFVLARFLNAFGVSMFSNQSFGRFYGIILSWIIIITLATTNAWLVLV